MAAVTGDAGVNSAATAEGDCSLPPPPPSQSPSSTPSMCPSSNSHVATCPCDSAHWDEMAKVFDAFVSLTVHFSKVALDHVAEDILGLIQKKEHDTCHDPVIIDVAGGTGSCALEAARRFPRARVLLTDISDAMLNVARKKIEADPAIANVEVKLMDGQHLQMGDDSVDALTCVFGIMFFPDRSRGWREMHRVLRPGSRAAVVTWMTPGPHILTTEAIAKFDAELEEEEKKKKEEAEAGVPSQVLGAIANQEAETGKDKIEKDKERNSTLTTTTTTTALAKVEDGKRVMLCLPSAAAIADDLALSGCQFSKVDIYPVPHVWEGIEEGDIDRMSSLWGHMPNMEATLAGRDIDLVVIKLREAMRARLNERGNVAVPCQALLTVLTK